MLRRPRPPVQPPRATRSRSRQTTPTVCYPLKPTVGVDGYVATGFLALGPRMLAEQDKETLVLDTVDQQVDLVGRTFLGLTLGCARCHDHKFDPVPTRDYYAMAGIFRSTQSFRELGHVATWFDRELASDAQIAARKAADAEFQQAEQRVMQASAAAAATQRIGRTPTSEGGNGRDHNPHAFTDVLAGGGVRQGFSYGATDDYGYYATEDTMHVHDLHATILHLLGLDHERLTHRYAGRDFRLTDVAGKVARAILA